MTPAPTRFLLLTLLLLASHPVWGQTVTTTSASHTVRVGIQPITVIAVSGDPLPLHMVRGEEQTQTGDASSRYNLTSNVDGVRIEAALDFPMPAGLSLRLRADTGLGRSRGFIDLSGAGSPRHLVSHIGRGLENGRSLEYQLLADADADVVPMQERRVTVSIVNPKTGFRQEVTQVVSFSLEEAPGFDLVSEPSK